MLEVKRTLDGKVVEYPAELLLLGPGIRAVLLCRIDEPEGVAGGRMTLPPRTLSVGYFWCERSYNVYHRLHGGKTLLHYLNIGRITALSDGALVWDDYACGVRKSGQSRSQAELVDQPAKPISPLDAAAFGRVHEAGSRSLGVRRSQGERPVLLPLGFALEPARCTRRLPSSMKKSTYSLPNQNVSTVKKSQAIALRACARRNSCQESPARSPAGGSPASRRILRTVVAETATPRPASSPAIR
jgi:hypothetical protein